MLRRIFSVAIAISFLLNSVCFADIQNSDTLAPESRLSPITDNAVMLDIMKLTAEIIDLSSREDISIRERTDYRELAVIDEITPRTTQYMVMMRPGDKIVYNFREKVVTPEAVFIPCSITGKKQGGAASSKRNYLCCAKETLAGGYDFEFIPAGSKDIDGKSVSQALKSGRLLETLSGKSRSGSVRSGISRYVEQQRRDRVIAAAIRASTEQRFSSSYSYVWSVENFLNKSGFKVAESFLKLISLGQLMLIPGLDVPHAGGMGIYLPLENKQYHNAQTLLHEIFAKCGLSHEDCLAMEKIYDKWVDSQELDESEQAILQKAKNVDFENRWDDVLNIDYNKDGFLVPAETLRGEDRNWYLGIDSSTQSVKFMLIEEYRGVKRVIWMHREVFDSPHYAETFKAPGGVLPHPHAPDQYHTDPLMLADALDRGMRQLSQDIQSSNLYFGNLKAISGAGQQHGTVYLNHRAEQALKDIVINSSPDSDSYSSDTPKVPLWEQLQDAGIFSNLQAPIWQDAKTAAQVARINKAAGGADQVRNMTGSKGTLRFSLAQIMAFFDNQWSAFRGTKTVLNIAAYNGALLTANSQFPWDPGDGAGTNAMDIRNKVWLTEFLYKLMPGLANILSPIRPTHEYVGQISSYWVNKYGFPRGVSIVNFTGDNPSGLTGMGVIKEGEIVVSLGTSYTMFTFVPTAGLDRALEAPIGHVFGEPTGQYMNLVCFQNGDRTLETLREKYISEDEALARARTLGLQIMPTDKKELEVLMKQMRIEIFTDELQKTQAGNNGAMMVAMHKTEDVVRIPFVEGKTYARNLDQASRAQVFRAAVEGQAYFMKWIADQIGLNVSSIKLTGGVAKNPVIRQIMADIFNVQVNVLAVDEAVALGSAIRAMKATQENMSWEEAIKDLTKVDEQKTVLPRQDSAGVYKKQFPEFAKLLDEAMYDGRVADAVTFHKEEFKEAPEATAIGPGRINLLGEHVDYAGGHVLPIALDGVDVIATASKRTDGKICIASPRFGEKYEISVAGLKAITPDFEGGLKAIPEQYGWARYPLGVVRQMMDIKGINITGLNISYDGNVPLGGGLSSSAAVETAVWTALDGIFKTGLSKADAARLTMAAEHWRGNKCGIMDQFASLHGKKGAAVLLDCNSLQYEEVDIGFLETAGYAIVAVDTGLPKTDEAWQRYMARRGALERAVEEFFKQRPNLGINSILDIAPKLTLQLLIELEDDIVSALGQEVFKRLSHVVFEEARVQKLITIARQANILAERVKSGDESARQDLDVKVREFGDTILRGHESMSVLYEMSSIHLDKLVSSAMAYGSVGSRVTGAGVVGCTVNIVKKEDIGKFREGVSADYQAAFPELSKPKITVSQAGDGARLVKTENKPEVSADKTPAAKNKIFPNEPVITVVGSIVADIIVPMGEGSDYPVPDADSGLVAEGDKVFKTPPAEATKAYLDSLRPDQRSKMTITYGGPGLASAFGMHELGAKVKLVGAVGDDDIGRGLISLMESKGMDTTGIKVVKGISTSTNLIFSNKTTGDTAYNLALNGANEYLTAEDVRDEFLQGTAVLHLGGIALNPKLMNELSGLISRAKAKGVKVGWDTVVDLYGKEKAMAHLMGEVAYITPSMKEAVKISGMASVEENLGFFRRLGSSVAIFLKNGANGSEVSTTPGSVFGVAVDMHMPSTTVVGFEDSTGAGDSYSAFIGCAVASGWTPKDAAEGASVCGALTCERRGGASITETPEEAYHRKMSAFKIELARSQEPTCTFNISEGLPIRGANTVLLERKPALSSDRPQIVGAKVAPNGGMNLISLMVQFQGQPEPTEVLFTGSPEELAAYFAEGELNKFGKNPFTKAGAVIGPIPNRAVGEVIDGQVKVTFPNGATVMVPANHEGSNVPRYHLHGFFHRLAQTVRSWLGMSNRSASVEGVVDVKGRSDQWQWPSDSNITTRRTLTSDNKLRLTVIQKNTGDEKTWASWVDHSYFRHPLGIARDDVRLKFQAESMSMVGRTPEGQPDYKDCLPTGELRDVRGTPYDFNGPEGRALGRLFLDDNFTNLVKQPDGSVIVEVLYPELGYKLRIRAYDKVTRADGRVETGKLKSIQIYSPSDSDFVCVEIGAHLNDPFNEAVWGDRDTGMVALSPGDAYEYNYEVEYLPIEDEIKERISDITPFSESQLQAIIQTGRIDETLYNARRLAASYIDPKTRSLALEAIKSIRKDERRRTFVTNIAKESFNVLNRHASPELPNLPPEKIEMATFGLYAADDFEAFVRAGMPALLLETVVNYRAGAHDPNDPSGHTGKTLINLPWQLLPEHRHVDLVVLKKGVPIPDDYTDAGLIPGFTGVLEYNPDGTATGKVLYSIDDYTIAVAKSHESRPPEDRIAYFPGKSETFKFTKGSAIVFGDRSRMTEVSKVKGFLTEVPAELREVAERYKKQAGITANDMMYVRAGSEVLLEKNTLHALLALDEGVVYEEYSTPSRDEADLFTDPRIVRQPPQDGSATKMKFSDGLDESVIEIAAGESRNTKAVVFVSQDFATTEKCKNLMQAFSSAEFVSFNQHTQLNDLHAMLSDAKYADHRKILITMSLKEIDMQRAIARGEEAFKEAMLFNIDSEFAGELRGPLQASFQRGVLSMGLLAAGMPKGQEYRNSNSYLVLRSLLTMVFGNTDDAEKYIANLVNPDGSITVSMRFGYLINKMIGPAQRLVVNAFTQIVKIFA